MNSRDDDEGDSAGTLLILCVLIYVGVALLQDLVCFLAMLCCQVIRLSEGDLFCKITAKKKLKGQGEKCTV